MNNAISCNPSVDLIYGLLYFSYRRNTEYERSVRNVHKNTKSIFRDDHLEKQPENLRLKLNELFSSFLFATVLIAFITLEGNDRLYHSFDRHFDGQAKRRGLFVYFVIYF